MAQKDEDFDAVRKEVAAEIAAINAGKPNHEDLVRELAVTKLTPRESGLRQAKWAAST